MGKHSNHRPVAVSSLFLSTSRSFRHISKLLLARGRAPISALATVLGDALAGLSIAVLLLGVSSPRHGLDRFREASTVPWRPRQNPSQDHDLVIVLAFQ